MDGFKKPVKKFAIRKRKSSEDEDEDDDATGTVSTIEEVKFVQKTRKRPHGVSLEELATAKPEGKEVKKSADPLRLETGGYVDMKALKTGKVADEVKEQIGTAFASETNRRDEDTEMLKYVEEELTKRKGLEKEQEVKQINQQETEINKLYELPEHIKKNLPTKQKKEDMISNQMLSGIPEVDLGIDAKIKNIEATEEAKQRLMEERNSRKGTGVSDFVPTNYAANFVQHNRYNVEDSSTRRPRSIIPTPAPLRVGDFERQPTEPRPKIKATEKATDDFHFEKFKKQMRKY